VSGNSDSPSEINIISEELEILIKATDFFKDITANQRPCSTYGKNFMNAIVLTLVILGRFKSGPASAI